MRQGKAKWKLAAEMNSFLSIFDCGYDMFSFLTLCLYFLKNDRLWPAILRQTNPFSIYISLFQSCFIIAIEIFKNEGTKESKICVVGLVPGWDSYIIPISLKVYHLVTGVLCKLIIHQKCKSVIKDSVESIFHQGTMEKSLFLCAILSMVGGLLLP